MSEPSPENGPSTDHPTFPDPNIKAGPSKWRPGSIVLGCFGAIFTIWILSMIILSLIGLITGYLYLPPARGSRALELNGTWARIVGAITLVFFGWLFYTILRSFRKWRRPKILGDG